MLFPLFDVPKTLSITIKPTLQLREQGQRHYDSNFSVPSPINRVELFSRWRPGFTASVGNGLSATFIYQYSNDWYWQGGVNSSLARSDVDQANIAQQIDGGRGRVTVGRQLLQKGNERLLGDPDFGIVGRTWDLVRFQDRGFDLFAGKLAVNLFPDAYQRLAGGSFDSPLGTTLLAYKHDYLPTLGSTDVTALDQLYRTKVNRITLDLEAVGEAGKIGGKTLQAWAYSARAGYTFNTKVRVYGEADSASGGQKGNTILTFDQFYPGNHPYYGILDVIGWRNMNDLMAGAHITEASNAGLNVEFHAFTLRAANDALYADVGTASKMFYDPTGSSGKDLGHELDVIQSYKFAKRQSFEVGFSAFRPGHFIENVNKTGANYQYWYYLQYTLKV